MITQVWAGAGIGLMIAGVLYAMVGNWKRGFNLFALGSAIMLTGVLFGVIPTGAA